MTSYLTDLTNRLVDMQVEALTSLITIDAVPYWPYQQGSFPYIYNNVTDISLDEITEGIDTRTVTAIATLVIGHYTKGYIGEIPGDLYEYIPLYIDFFEKHPMMTSTNYPGEPDWITPLGATAFLSTGIRGFNNSGVGNTQIGVQFTHVIPTLHLSTERT